MTFKSPFYSFTFLLLNYVRTPYQRRHRLLLPKMLGESGIWLALALSELLTTACFAAYAALRR